MDDLVQTARRIAIEALRDDFRSDGRPFIGHPDGVARIVEDEIGLDPESIAAVYLHEAQRFHPEVDISAFPQGVRTMVDGLNKISTIKPLFYIFFVVCSLIFLTGCSEESYDLTIREDNMEHSSVWITIRLLSRYRFYTLLVNLPVFNNHKECGLYCDFQWL